MKLVELKNEIKIGDRVNERWNVIGLGIHSVICILYGRNYRRHFYYHPTDSGKIIEKVERDGRIIYSRPRKAKKIIMKISKKKFFSKHDPKILPIIRKATVGIAGVGGLGSNVAVSLARVGIGKLIIADFDTIEASNLNRQQYFIEQIGKPKVIALLENLKKINPFSEYQIHHIKLNEKNIPIIFKDVDILVEAFDKAEMKKMLIETWLSEFPEKPIIAASGLSGYGMNELIHTKKLDNLYICGDEITKLKNNISPMAPRVGIVANMQANLVLEMLLM